MHPEPTYNDVVDADLSLSEDARKKDQRHDQSKTTTAADPSTTEAESTTTAGESTTTAEELTTIEAESANTAGESKPLQYESTTAVAESTTNTVESTTAGASTTMAVETTSTEAESVEIEPLPEVDAPPSAGESMDISYEDTSDSDLPGVEGDSEDEDDETSINDAIQMENYKGNVEIM